jgi:aspartate aminotransferase
MTGWRIGYAAGPTELMRAVLALQSQSTSNPCSISQAAAEEALSGDQACVTSMAAEYRKRHDFIVPALNALPGFSCRPGDGTFYAFPQIQDAATALGLQSDAEFAEHLIEKARVATVPGSAFGAPGYLRLSFASSMDELKTAIERVKAVLVA